YRGVVHVEVAADGADDDVTGVEADANLDEYTLPGLHALRVPFHRLLHPQGCITGPHRVVLMGQWRAEQRHDSVAHNLVHAALVAVDSLHHVLEDEVEKLLGLL